MIILLHNYQRKLLQIGLNYKSPVINSYMKFLWSILYWVKDFYWHLSTSVKKNEELYSCISQLFLKDKVPNHNVKKKIDYILVETKPKIAFLFFRSWHWCWSFARLSENADSGRRYIVDTGLVMSYQVPLSYGPDENKKFDLSRFFFFFGWGGGGGVSNRPSHYKFPHSHTYDSGTKVSVYGSSSVSHRWER